MSQPPKSKDGKTFKRKANAPAARPQANTAAADRAVRQRTDQSGLTGTPAAAAASSSVAVPIVLSAFMRLAVVERQLIMQGLDLTSLARLASTCRQLRSETLHREAGKLIPEPQGRLYYQSCSISQRHSAHASPLFRAHVPVRLSFDPSTGSVMTSAQQEALIVKAARFSRIVQLSVGRSMWTEAQALRLLAQPWIRSVSRVDLDSRSPAWLRSSVQHAVFALPHLTSIWLEIQADAKGFELLESALSQASKLTEAHCILYTAQVNLRALRVSPLSTLDLCSLGSAVPGGASLPLGPLVWCMPPTLTELFLTSFSLESESTPRSILKAMFLRLPKLRLLHTDWEMEIAPLLQGMLDAGVAALPALRRVEFDNGVNDDPDLMRRFMHRFPDVTVRFEFAHDTGVEALEEAFRMARWYGGWPRVEVDPAPTDGMSSPHASDDEAESDVEAAVDPSEAGAH